MKQKLIKLLGGYTKKEFNSLNEITIARKNCGSINLDQKWLEELSLSKRKNILSEADDIFSKESFAKICNELEKSQVFHIAKEAGSFNEMNFGRGTLNGISLVKSQIEELSSLNRKENQQDEVYDPYKIISQ